MLPLIFSLMIDSAQAKSRTEELNHVNQELAERDSRQPVDSIYQVQTTVGNLPPEIRSMDSRIKKADRRAGYTITVGMVSDNMTMRKMPRDGDDLGLTFGMFLKVNRLTTNGIVLTLPYSEDLNAKEMTKPVRRGSRLYLTQQTETEVILELMLDSSKVS